MGDIEKTRGELKRLKAKSAESVRWLKEAQEKRVKTIRVNKRTQRIRFEGETEDQVTVIIESKTE